MYKPNNTPVYLRAFAGFMAGITAPSNTDTEPKNFVLYALMADAWGQEVDTLWGSDTPTGLELILFEQVSAAVWENRSPLTSDLATTPGAYEQPAESVIARVRQGNAQVVAEGIDPNNVGGGGGGGSVTAVTATFPLESSGGTAPDISVLAGPLGSVLTSVAAGTGTKAAWVPASALSLSSLLWVDQTAPAGGNGSVGSPFNTIAAANAAFLAQGQPSRANKNGIMLVPGIYAENVELYPWIFIIGTDPFTTRLTGTLQLWTDPGAADNYWNPPDNPDGDLTDMRGGLVNVLVTNPITIDFNVGPTPGSTHNGSNEGKFYFENCICNSLFEMIGFSLISQGQARHTTFFAGYTIKGANFQTENTNVTGGGTLTVEDNGSNLPGALACFGGATNGPVLVQSTSMPSAMTALGFALQGSTLTLAGAQATYTGSPESIPLKGAVILSGGAASPTLANDPTGLAYTPGLPSNWKPPAPTTVQEAMDRMAATIVSIDGGNPIA